MPRKIKNCSSDLLFIDVAGTVPLHLLHQAGETESEVNDVLAQLESQAIPLLM